MDTQKQIDGGRLGGLTRAARLTADERREIAQRAAEARWGEGMPRETHSGVLELAGARLECAVLADGRRVLSRRAVGRAFGAKTTGAKTRVSEAAGPILPAFLESKSLSPFIPERLRLVLASPFRYRFLKGGGFAYAYEATMLPDICGVVIAADDADSIPERQRYLVKQAKALLMVLAKVGIIALVDEATGFQADREQDDLRRIFEKFISQELRPWTKRFPDEFFQEVFRLHGWEYNAGTSATPRYVGKLINRYVYERLPEGVLEALKVRNPADEAGRRRHRHHQYLTNHTGDPNLDRQIDRIVTLMQGSDSKTAFDRAFRRVFPAAGDQVEMDALDVS